MDRAGWWVTAHGVTKSQTLLVTKHSTVLYWQYYIQSFISLVLKGQNIYVLLY